VQERELLVPLRGVERSRASDRRENGAVVEWLGVIGVRVRTVVVVRVSFPVSVSVS
jgi:hypothetical protein